jgi:hypothetical protein
VALGKTSPLNLNVSNSVFFFFRWKTISLLRS